jgi:predicted nucleic acid-binding protein
MMYFDTSYLVRLYYKDPGYEAVRQLVETAPVACSLHGRAEVVAALHRKVREGSLAPDYYRITLREFADECRAGGYRWLPLSPAVFDRVERIYTGLSAAVFLSAADALHLACAAENGFKEIYSNDQRLLAAAVHFGIKGVNVI